MVDRLTPERLEELRRIAEAATPGPWAVNPFKALVDEMATLTPVCAMLWPTDLRTEEQTLANAKHIATFDPTTVLALLNRVEELSLACAAALRVLVAAGLFEQDEDGNITADARFYDDLCELANAARYVADYATDGLVAESEACLRHQFDAARAEAERWKQQYEALLDEIERLQREREEIVDGETRFVLYHPDFDWWECQACRFLWEFMEGGDPYEHDMRFCPRCGRRIVRGCNKSTVITLKQRERH